MIIRVTGVLLIILGGLFWAGRGLRLIPLHMLLGVLLVLALWFMAFRALSLGAGRGLAAGAIVWGIIVFLLGFAQRGLLPGSAHWVIQVIHLLIGLAAIALGEQLGAAMKAQPPPSRAGALA